MILFATKCISEAATTSVEVDIEHHASVESSHPDSSTDDVVLDEQKLLSMTDESKSGQLQQSSKEK